MPVKGGSNRSAGPTAQIVLFVLMCLFCVINDVCVTYIGVMTPLASSYVASNFGLRSITNEGMHHFHSNPTEG